MLRVRTNVTVSPLVSRRSSSANWATAPTSVPRALKSVTISSRPSSWPARRAVEHFLDRAAGLAGERELHRLRVGARVPGGRAAAGEPDLGPVGDVGDVLEALREHGARVVAAEALGVGAVDRREPQVRVDPVDELGVDGQARGELLARGLGGLAQALQRRPRALGVDEVGGDRGHAAPVVDARVQQRAHVARQVRGRLHVHVAREDLARQPDRVQVLLLRARRVIAHRGARLGQEVLDDHLLHVAVAGVGSGDRLQRVDPVLAVLADPDQDARRERDPQLARPFQRGEAAGGQLVRRAAMARQVLAQALDHHALRDGDALQELQLLARDGAGVGVREQPGLLDDELAHRRQVLDRGRRSRWPPAIRAPPRTGSPGTPRA